MKLKLTAERMFRGLPHAHHANSKRSRWKADVCGETAKTHYAQDQEDELTAFCEDEPSPYPAALLEVFRDASEKCPSISMNPGILDGQPCIVGTRIPVHSVLRAIEHYGSLEAAVSCYPHLTIPQVKDALYFAQIVLEPADGIDETETSA